MTLIYDSNVLLTKFLVQKGIAANMLKVGAKPRRTAQEAKAEKEQSKAKNLLAEINQMQLHIDQIARSEEVIKRSQVKIKDDCHRRIHTLKAVILQAGAEEEGVETQRRALK